MKLLKEHIDPRNGDLPFRKIAFLETAERLDSRLAPILWDELSAGNRIWEATGDYPREGSVSVSLGRPFNKIYRVPEGVRYTVEDDGHYNVVSYVTEAPVPHTLCAPFRE